MGQLSNKFKEEFFNKTIKGVDEIDDELYNSINKEINYVLRGSLSALEIRDLWLSTNSILF